MDLYHSAEHPLADRVLYIFVDHIFWICHHLDFQLDRTFEPLGEHFFCVPNEKVSLQQKTGQSQNRLFWKSVISPSGAVSFALSARLPCKEIYMRPFKIKNEVKVPDSVVLSLNNNLTDKHLSPGSLHEPRTPMSALRKGQHHTF